MRRFFTDNTTFRRLRHFRGHGIHSPFVYNLVRHALMVNDVVGESTLYEKLLLKGIDRKTSRYINNIYNFCNFDRCIIAHNRSASVHVDSSSLVVVIAYDGRDYGKGIFEQAIDNGATIIFTSNSRYKRYCREYSCSISSNKYLSIEKRGFIAFFGNRGFSGQHFKL